MVHPFSAGCNYFFSIIDGDVKNASIPNQTSKKNKTAKPNHQNSESAHNPTTKPKKNRESPENITIFELHSKSLIRTFGVFFL